MSAGRENGGAPASSVVYALDFDGVLCDSVDELIESVIRAARRVFAAHSTETWYAQLGSDPVRRQLTHLRPLIKTGYELVLLCRALAEGQYMDSDGPEQLRKAWPEPLKEQLLEEYNSDFGALNGAFSAERDDWIENDLDSWLAANKMFPGVVDALNQSEALARYIITTKDKRYALRLLRAAGVTESAMPDDRVYGLGMGSKIEVLKIVLKNHPGAQVHFVEDYVPALESASISLLGANVQYFMASWGYNTLDDVKRAERNPFITVLDLDTFTSRMQ
ncbi:hypothetical protein FVE85_1924 [Porphyridium purpureum]|uniref:Uncharacterized protein n=1 Tax=Porphyridium purpureum TaxID=35688 RepID=A0A5J4YW54_PORPP|nr:hypothetical protein FVE85_1924 [Porphyridium purpureum]|eukprot:POR4217..scf209_3